MLATDADTPAASLVFSLAGGADQALFQINAGTGELSFLAAPNHDVPGDANADNVFEVTVQVSDGSLVDTQALSVTVTNVNEAPSGTSATWTTAEDTPAGTGRCRLRTA